VAQYERIDFDSKTTTPSRRRRGAADEHAAVCQVAKVINSSGFVIAGLFSDKQNQTTPALGTIMNQKRVPAYEPRTKRWHQHCASGLRLIRRPAARSIRAP
jgi:hypothetical protein